MTVFTPRAGRGTITPIQQRKKSYFARDPTADGASRQDVGEPGEMQFEAIVCTERYVKVLLPGSREVIEEVLIASGGQFPKQVPLFDNHNRFSIANQLGAVRDFRQDQSIWYGAGRFTPGVTAAAEAWARVKAGHATDVSIGYTVLSFTEIRPGESKRVDGRLWRAGNLWIRVATRWQVNEVSLATIGADEAAKIEPPKPRSRNAFFAR